MSMIQCAEAFGASGGLTGNERSLRIRQSALGHLSKTWGAAPTSAYKFTVSFWVKRGNGTTTYMFMRGAGGNVDYIGFDNSTYVEQLWVRVGSSYDLYFTGANRDFAGWAHYVVAIDTSNATSTERVKGYKNGEQLTLAAGSYPAQNTVLSFNKNATAQVIGRTGFSTSYSYDGLFAEWCEVDGQQLTPSSFGELNTNNIWVPKAYTGSYGNNGFYLDFQDTTSTTTLCYDKSGNNNHWTPNNISLTAGVTYDSMLDYPVNGTAGTQPIGNYCTLNPLGYDNASNVVSDGNLKVAWTAGGNSYKAATIGMSSGKFYCEFFIDVVSTAAMPGLVNDVAAVGYPGNNGAGNGYGYYYDGTKYTSGSASAYGSSFTTGDIIGIAYDASSGKLWFSKNGVWQASGDPANGLNPAFSGLSLTSNWFFAAGHSGSATMTANFGQRPFAYTPPTGFKALCTTNMTQPASAVAKSSDNFNVVLDTGANIKATAEALFTYELEWIKDRANSNNHQLLSSVSGSNVLRSNLQGPASTYSTPSGDSVGWVWKLPSAGVSNTAGSITSTVAANTDAGISVVTYIGNSVSGATIGHGLGATPKMIIVNAYSGYAGADWLVYIKNMISTYEIAYLNYTLGGSTSTGYFTTTAPTSSVFSVSSNPNMNASPNSYLAICFAEIEGFSKFGSYTGNGSTDGSFVYCGFRPKFVLVKRTDSASNWSIYDAAVGPYNKISTALLPNNSGAENTGHGIDFLSNGFKCREAETSSNSGTHIFAAFAEYPFALNCRAR